MASWDISQTKQLISAKFGPNQLRLATNCLRAVNERLRHARYHFQEVKKLLTNGIDKRLPKESIYLITFPTTSEEMSEFDNLFAKVEANAIAGALAIHSVADNLAHVVFFSLGMNLFDKPLAARQVNIQSVRKQLQRGGSDTSPIFEALGKLVEHPDFQYVDDFANSAKHRGFAETRINVEPPERGTKYAFELGSFQFDETAHVGREIEEALAPAYAAASTAVVQTGKAINHWLSCSLSGPTAPP